MYKEEKLLSVVMLFVDSFVNDANEESAKLPQ